MTANGNEVEVPPIEKVWWEEEDKALRFRFKALKITRAMKITSFAFYDRDGKEFSRKPLEFDVPDDREYTLQVTYTINLPLNSTDSQKGLVSFMCRTVAESMQKELK
jgi:hypothetical protein